MERSILLIDGFNFYHSISKMPHLKKYKWVNFHTLASILIPKSHRINGVYYFTALAHWDQRKVRNHRLFIGVQEHFGVQTIYGKFKMKDRECRLCHGVYKIPEEKQTDVNIAITLLSLAFRNEFDNAYIISGDSDLIPSIRAVKNIFPSKKIGVAVPIHRTAIELQNIADFHMRIKEKHLKSSLLPDEIDINGRKIIRPSHWI
ncbi:MAG TPA: NYN domain-containing protein [Spirochaetota bacterium]|nr:NYN domain-containing protein [Spirochaetota bacterium]HPQ54327.1 NYN domain-containing protein [Spirochaetota bacterium]